MSLGVPDPLLQAIEWVVINETNGSGFLQADFALIVSKNLDAFGVSARNEKRYVANVLGSETFQRRYRNFVERLQSKNPEARVHLDAENLKGDLLAFALFIRCCNGPVSDSIIVEDALRDAFVGHGDFRPVLELFEDALAAGALTTPIEQAAVGVTPETNSECLRELQAGLAQALKRLDETDTTVNTMQSDVRTLQTDLGVLQLSAIPESHRLYVCGFADQHFNIETDFPQLTRLEVLGIYGSLICRSLGQQGLRNSVAKEPRGDGSFRNVYDDRVHLSTFEDCRALLPAAVAEEVARRSIRLSPQALFDREMDRLTLDQRQHLFRDIRGSKSQKLSEATTDRDRELVLLDRRKSVWFIFSRLFQADMNVAANHGHVADAAEVASRVFKEACEQYEDSRLKKAQKESAQAPRRKR